MTVARNHEIEPSYRGMLDHVMLPDGRERALSLARCANERLGSGQTSEAAWFALDALETDDRCALAWSVLARILLEVSQDPLGTLGSRYALELGVPAPEQRDHERHYQIDLWARGLLMARDRESILSASDFDRPGFLRETPRLEAWFEEKLEEWGDLARAALALRRMVAALADAWSVPETGSENPLRAERGWLETPAFRAWRESDPLTRSALIDATSQGIVSSDGAPAVAAPSTPTTVLSDYWIEQEISELAAGGGLEQAHERALLWSRLRPLRMRPKTILLRVEHAAGRIAERDHTISSLVSMPSQDLNELEEARIALGELRLWEPQIEILSRMDAIAPRHPVILANRGVAYIEIGKREAGTEDLEAALEVDPENGPALANLGLERMRRDEYVAARILLERAVHVAPEQPLARLYLAACKNNQGDREGAIEDLNEVLRIDPSHAQAKQLLLELQSHVVRPS